MAPGAETGNWAGAARRWPRPLPSRGGPRGFKNLAQWSGGRGEDSGAGLPGGIQGHRVGGRPSHKGAAGNLSAVADRARDAASSEGWGARRTPQTPARLPHSSAWFLEVPESCAAALRSEELADVPFPKVRGPAAGAGRGLEEGEAAAPGAQRRPGSAPSRGWDLGRVLVTTAQPPSPGPSSAGSAGGTGILGD